MNFWEWFLGDAGAAWIIGILTLVITIGGGILAYSRREKPPVLLIQELEQQSMLSIHPSRKEKLQALYKDQDGKEYIVQNLQQKEVAIYNLGSKDILDPIQFVLEIGGSSGKDRSLFEIIFDDNDCKHKKQADNHDNKLKTLITIPYLNSFQKHGHYHRAYLLSDANMDITLEHGMGKGWSSRFVSLDTCEKALSKFSKFVTTTQVSIAAILLIIMVFATNVYKSPQLIPVTLHVTQNSIEIVTVPQPQLQIETPIGTFTLERNLLWEYLFNNQLFTILFICFVVLILIVTIIVFSRNVLVYKIYLKCLPPSSLAQHKNA